MTTHVVLLRAVNVGGTGKLPMADLRRLAEDAGFTAVRTYIASGNLLLESDDDEATVGKAMEDALEAYAGRPVGVLVRSPGELQRVLDGNPFPGAPGNRVAVIFLPGEPAPGALEGVTRADDGEQVALGERAVYAHYPNGQGRSRLRVPGVERGTARNVNTVRALLELAAG